MQTLKLRVSDRMYDKLMQVFIQMDPSEVEVLDQDASFEASRKYLHTELQEILEGKATFHSLDELDKNLDKMLEWGKLLSRIPSPLDWRDSFALYPEIPQTGHGCSKRS